MEPSPQQELLAQQANDLLNRLHTRRLALYREAVSMPIAEYKRQRARIAHVSDRAFARLSRRLAPFL